MRHFLILLGVPVLFAACAATTGSDGARTELSTGPRLTHSQEEAEAFIRRFAAMRVGLVNYFDPTAVEFVSREFSAETVIFRLDATGDTGLLHEAAANRAAELAIDFGWEYTTAPDETLVEGNLALVRIESIGVPAGARAGDHIPVRVTMTGNGSDIHGGYVYTTPLRNRLGRTVAVLREGYLPFNIRNMDPDDVTEEMRRDAEYLERRDSLVGASFVLRRGVRLATNIHTDDLTADQIILPLQRVVEEGRTVQTLTSDLLPFIVEDIRGQLAELGIESEVTGEAGRIVIKPLGVRELTLRQIYQRVEDMRVEIRPRTKAIVLFDDNLFRVAIYGPTRHRFLIRDVSLTTDPFSRDTPGVRPQQLAFRVSCRVLEHANPGRAHKYGIPDAEDLRRGIVPDGHTGRVRLAWSLWNERGRMVREGTEEIDTTDVSEILRHLWTRGMGPRDVLAFVYEAVENFALNAELGFNPLQIDFDRLDESR